MTNSLDFFLRDYPNTLFPLNINKLMAEKFSGPVQQYIQNDILGSGNSFLPQQRVMACKRDWLIRPTVKLDPVAEFYLYDLVYRNRQRFRGSRNQFRKVHGFRIQLGLPISTIRAYADFKRDISVYRRDFRHCAYFDVASYFNHIYHHDLVGWFEDIGADEEDVANFGRFLREITCGRSIDCLPQGLYPSKMIGSSFLSFIEHSSRLKASQTVRLMDDIWLFDNDKDVLISDFILIQSMLSKRGLSINDRKSKIGNEWGTEPQFPIDIDEIKVELLQRRRQMLSSESDYGEELESESDDEDREESKNELAELSEEEHDYLLSLLSGSVISEEDAELVLTLMRDHSSDVMEFIPRLMRDFPALSRRIYQFCAEIEDKDEVAVAILDCLQNSNVLTEFQLFWFGMMAENYLLKTKRVGELLCRLFENENATEISKAKILEISDKKYGLPDWREEQLRTGHSNWLGWAAAVGMRNHAKGQRNKLLQYFSKASQMNKLVGDFVAQCF